MDKFTFLVQLLEIEEEPFELMVLKKWVEEKGIDYVYERCLKMVKDKNEKGD